MFKTLSAAVVALSLVVVAQPAFAQKRGSPYKPAVAQPVTGFNLMIAQVSPTSVFGRGGTEWSFTAGMTATVNGNAVAPSSLAVGMTCVLNGARTSLSSGTITSIACKTA